MLFSDFFLYFQDSEETIHSAEINDTSYDFWDLEKKLYIPGNYDDSWEFAPGDTAFCTECLCKGMHKFKKLCITVRP